MVREPAHRKMFTWCRTLLSGASACILLLGLSGCAQGRDYAVPDEICGERIDADLLSPLMPTGTKINESGGTSETVRQHCKLSVLREDGDNAYETAVLAKWDIVPAGTDPLKVKKDQLERYGNPRRADIGEDARIADTGVLTVEPCSGRDKNSTLAVEIYLGTKTPEKLTDRQAALKRFTEDYLDRVFRKQRCEG